MDELRCDGDRYYSQHGEDYILKQLFFGKKEGFFIDVGAFDGIHLSNSFLFEKIGWKGICVEAHPFYFEKCQDNRTNSICVHAACVGDENMDSVEFNIEELGLFSGINKQVNIENRYKPWGLKFKGYEKVKVKATTLNKILNSLNDIPEIDFISIDVEGSELDVMRGFDIKYYSPRICVIEANSYEDEIRIDNFVMSEAGYYKAIRFNENIFYCRDHSDVSVLRNIDMSCFVDISDHPLGGEYNYPSIQNTKHKNKLLSIFKNLMEKVIK